MATRLFPSLFIWSEITVNQGKNTDIFCVIINSQVIVIIEKSIDFCFSSVLLIFTENFLRKQAHGLSTCKQEENDEAHYPGAGDTIGVSATKPPKKIGSRSRAGILSIEDFSGFRS